MSNNTWGQARDRFTDYVPNKKMSNIVWGPAPDRHLRAAVVCENWTPYIFSAALFYALWAILCFSNFRHGQAWHHRCGSKDMGQAASLLAWLRHSFRPTAPLGAEACPWFSFYFFVLNIKQSWLMDTMTPQKISNEPLFVAQHRNTRNYKNLLICRTTNARLVFKTY